LTEWEDFYNLDRPHGGLKEKPLTKYFEKSKNQAEKMSGEVNTITFRSLPLPNFIAGWKRIKEFSLGGLS
jgi:hypothetical protein